MKEEWRSITGYEGIYEVSNLGRVKSIPRQAGIVHIKGRILKQFDSKNGYLCVLIERGMFYNDKCTPSCSNDFC